VPVACRGGGAPWARWCGWLPARGGQASRAGGCYVAPTAERPVAGMAASTASSVPVLGASNVR